MSDYSTEEEQIAAIKNWWKNNGSSLLVGVGVALIIVFGWKAYQSSVVQDKTEASVLYQQLITAATANDFNEEEGSTVNYLAKELKSKFTSSEYAIYAAMFIAKESIADSNFEQAKKELNWIISNTDDLRLIHIANGRIARILSIEGDNDSALKLLVATDPAFEASYQEIIGDIHKRSNDQQAAIEAYTKAYKLVKSTPQALPLLAVKLSNLGIDPETL